MEYTKTKDKTTAELATMLEEKKVLLFTLEQKLKTMQLTNPKETNEARENIARVNTAINALK